MFIYAARILGAFNISPGGDERGNIILPDADAGISDGLVVRPPDFPCKITPRYAEVPALIAHAKEMYGFAADA
ncbi:hypothetical protein MPER_00522 [Moniliophthora perniciosa FA553]|nr:hypothetical protein MPER_00522 [Moniliophthora perniciosa FA553]